MNAQGHALAAVLLLFQASGTAHAQDSPQAPTAGEGSTEAPPTVPPEPEDSEPSPPASDELENASGDSEPSADEPESSESAPETGSEPTPPTLIESFTPEYPKEELGTKRQAQVLLRLTIDAEGQVMEAEVVESAGTWFDESARNAANQMLFAPARVADEAVTAKILYRVEFAPPAEALPPVAPPSATLQPKELPQDTSAPPPEKPVEVLIKGQASEAEILQDSAEAVNVIDMSKAKLQGGNLGEVLARSQGVGVRRAGGLGSDADISLDGLQGDQVRIFVDGVPIELSGYPFGIANIPVNLVERVEVYRGVVPIRFGADALGGAINVVTNQVYDPHWGVSYQHGSFQTNRVTVAGGHRHYPTGFVVRGSGFLDLATNNFEMSDRLIAQPDGSSEVRSVDRFHDAYRAYGANLEAGVVDRPWASKLLVKVFAAASDSDLQHNSVMSIPYGEVTYGETTYGTSLVYEVALLPQLKLDTLLTYAYRDLAFRDMATHVYRWTGEQGRIIGREIAPGEPARGEIRGEAIDESIYEHNTYGRAGLAWTITPEHIARVSVTPQFVFRTGDDHVPDRVDLLQLDDTLQKVVSGAEYELNLFDKRLQNSAFGKIYYQRTTHEERPDRNVNQDIFEAKRSMTRGGGGDAIRFRFTDWFLAKASYEYAIRLPRVDELFGDGVLVSSSAALDPERSHNVNLGPRLELRKTPVGDVTFDSNAFLRDVKDMIVLLGGQQFMPYANIGAVRGMGVENALSWESPRRYLGLQGTVTYQDFRNRTKTGVFEPMYGMRVPNRPYMFASWGAHSRATRIFTKQDALQPYYYGRYVHSFDRAWKLGDPDLLPTLPAQTSHAVGLTYSITRDFGSVASTFEIDNLTNARLYDYYGVQRPGRFFSFKLTAEL